MSEAELLQALEDAVAHPNLYRRGSLVAAAQRACEEAGIADERQREAACRGRERRHHDTEGDAA